MVDFNKYLLPKGERAEFKFSYSEKRDITICPHRYKILSVDKLPQDLDVRRLLAANVTDSALTTWINSKFTGKLSDLADFHFAEYVKSNRYIRWKSPMDQRDQQLHVVEVADKLDKIMRDYGMCLPDAVTQKHLKIVITLSDGRRLSLTGRSDLFYENELWCYDLKTTKDKRWLDVDQLVFYDFVTSLMLGRKLKKCGFLAPLINPPVQYLEVEREDWQKLLEDLNKGIKSICEADFPDLGDEKVDCFLCFAKSHCKRYARQGASSPLIQVGKSVRTGFKR